VFRKGQLTVSVETRNAVPSITIYNCCSTIKEVERNLHGEAAAKKEAAWEPTMSRPQKSSVWRQRSAASVGSTLIQLGASPWHRTMLLGAVVLLWILLLRASSPDWNGDRTNRLMTHPKTSKQPNAPVTSLDNEKIHIVFSTGCNAFQDCTSFGR
jgi:hypothetical protein